jgi:tetratricopeptide (TPR) repeat protein
VTALVFGVAACGGPDARRQAFTRDLVRLETDAAVGRHGEAIQRAGVLLGTAEGARETCPVLVARARALAGVGRDDEALSDYRRIAAECAGAPLESSAAMLHMARWVADRDQPAAALPVLESLILAFPDEPAARRAVTWLRDLRLREAGPVETAAALAALADRVPANRAVAANLRFEAAILVRDNDSSEAGRDRALALFDRVVAEHPRHGLSNDALMARAEVLRTRGRPAEAVASLEALLARREWSFLIGSYEIDLSRKASALLPEVAREAGESAAEVARRQREHRRRYPDAR